jgi:hypothetical protein
MGPDLPEEETLRNLESWTAHVAEDGKFFQRFARLYSTAVGSGLVLNQKLVKREISRNFLWSRNLNHI